jgi:hypothetical protein
VPGEHDRRSSADAATALERFREQFDAKYPKAVAKLDKGGRT